MNQQEQAIWAASYAAAFLYFQEDSVRRSEFEVTELAIDQADLMIRALRSRQKSGRPDAGYRLG